MRDAGRSLEGRTILTENDGLTSAANMYSRGLDRPRQRYLRPLDQVTLTLDMFEV